MSTGILLDPEKIMMDLLKTLDTTLKGMSKAKDVNERESYSRMVKNLCDSVGVFLKLASERMQYGEDDEEDDTPF